MNRSCVFTVLRQASMVIFRACRLDAIHFLASVHCLRGATGELPPLAKGEQFRIILYSTSYHAKAELMPALAPSPTLGFQDGAILLALDGSWGPGSKFTRETHGRIFGPGHQVHCLNPQAGNVVYILHNDQLSFCKSGNSGA